MTVMLGNDLRWHTKANRVGRELLEAYFGARSPRAVASAHRGGAAKPAARKR